MPSRTAASGVPRCSSFTRANRAAPSVMVSVRFDGVASLVGGCDCVCVWDEASGASEVMVLSGGASRCALLPVVLDSALDRVFGEHRAVDLHRRQAQFL